MAKNRGPEPSKLTRYLLIARSAGRCQICNEFVLTDSFTMCDNDDSNVAHIVASSPDGPRGDVARSHSLSDCSFVNDVRQEIKNKSNEFS